MKRAKMSPLRTRTTPRHSPRTWARALAFEPLEQRDLLAVTLAGDQSVAIWDMRFANQILSQTEARFTLTASCALPGDAAVINWGDGSLPYQGTLDANLELTAAHTFGRGTCTVTATCDGEAGQYTYQCDTMAAAHLLDFHGVPSPSLSLFVMGNDSENRVSIDATRQGQLYVSMTHPGSRRTVSPDDITAVYGSLLGRSDSVTIGRHVATPMFFSLGDGNDRFSGGDEADLVLGGNGKDHIWGNGGNDVIQGGAGNDRLWGGASNDVFDGGTGDDEISGGGGDDMLYGYDGRDKLYGGAGNDLLEGGAGNDKLRGEDGNDLLYGSAGNDDLDGSRGDDWLFGEQGRDQLDGGSGNDVCIGGLDADRVYGGSGNNILGGGYDFLLNVRNRENLGAILDAWALHGQIPAELSTTNLRVWDDGASNSLQGGSGANLFYVGAGDRIRGRFRPGTDVRVIAPVPTAADVAVCIDTTTSGIVDPTGAAGRTTTLLGVFVADVGRILTKLCYRKTIDFGARPRSFQILNVPDQFFITSNQFWADYNRLFIETGPARGDVILGLTTPEAPPRHGGYGRECDLLESLGYLYDPATHQFLHV